MCALHRAGIDAEAPRAEASGRPRVPAGRRGRFFRSHCDQLLSSSGCTCAALVAVQILLCVSGRSILGRLGTAKGGCFGFMGRSSVYHERAYAGGATAPRVRRRAVCLARQSGCESACTGLGRTLGIGRGRIGLGTSRMRGRRDDGLPVYTYEAVPGVPLVSATRLGRELSPGGLPHVHPHSHDFLVLTYFERGGGSMWLGKREWRIEAGDAHVIAP